jgi:hypothetical protein
LVRLELSEAGLARITGIESGDLGSQSELSPSYTRWKLLNNRNRWELCFGVTPNSGWSCFTTVLKQNPSYQLYTILGDPDSNSGIEWSRVARPTHKRE